MNPLFIAPLLEAGSKLIDRIFPDKTAQASERAKAELELAALQQSGELQATAQQLSAIIAEAQSPDPWTSRARPSFLYVMYVMILTAIPMGILSAFNPEMAARIAEGMRLWLAAVPESMWAMFGVGYLGYTAARQYGKGKGTDK